MSECMTMDELRKAIAAAPNSIELRRALATKAIGKLAKRNPGAAFEFVRLRDELCIREGVTTDELVGPKRARHVVRVREALLTFLDRCDAGFNLSAAILGMRNHASALYAVRRMRQAELARGAGA